MTDDPTGQPAPPPVRDIVLATISADESILRANLLQSPPVATGALPLVITRNPASAATAFNRMLDETDAPVVVFLHNDVWLPNGWHALLRRRIAEVEAVDPHWALIGSFAVGVDDRRYGPVWSTSLGDIVGRVPARPVEALSYDEHLIVLRRGSGLRFDDALPSFHLYGTDMPLMARERGLRAWSVPLPLVHNDRFKRELGPSFAESYRYMRAKWRARLPLTTPVTRISWHGLDVWRGERQNKRSAAFRRAQGLPADVDPAVYAERCGWGNVAPAV